MPKYLPWTPRATVITIESASRGGYKQVKGHYMGLKKIQGPWSGLLRALYAAPIS